MVISIKKYFFNPLSKGVPHPLYKVFPLPSTEGLRSFSKEYGNPEKNVTFYSACLHSLLSLLLQPMTLSVPTRATRLGLENIEAMLKGAVVMMGCYFLTECS